MITSIDEQFISIRREKEAALVTQAESLAVRIDDLMYDYDFYSYVDTAGQAAIHQNRESLLSNSAYVDGVLNNLQIIVDDGGEYSGRAAALIEEVKSFSKDAEALMLTKTTSEKEAIDAEQRMAPINLETIGDQKKYASIPPKKEASVLQDLKEKSNKPRDKAPQNSKQKPHKQKEESR